MYKFLKQPYPNREEILEEKPNKETTYNPETINAFTTWKKTTWKELKSKDRFRALKELLWIISINEHKPIANIRLDPEAETPYYIPSCKTIFLNKHLSVISALHELGHHLYGESELLACRFSVHLFKEIFPKAFSHLVWENGMFRKAK